MKKLRLVRILIGICLCAYSLAACSHQARPTSTIKPTPTVLLTVAPTINFTNSPHPSTASLAMSIPSPTPKPSETPSYTPTPSAILLPSATHTQTVTQSETPVVLVYIAGLENLPVLTHDLQFIRGNRVMVWNHVTGQIEVKLDMNQWRDGVVEPKLTNRDHKIIRISGAGQSESNYGSGSVDIELIDTITGEIQLLEHFELVSGKNMVGDFSVSPMLNWITYKTGDLSQGSESPPDKMVLHAINLESPYQKIKVSDYFYTRSAVSSIWSPYEGIFLWEDARGIWISDLSQQSTHLLIAQEAGTGGSVSPLSTWSPSGRFLLTDVLGAIEGSSMAVLDIQTGRVADIIDTFEYAVPGATPGWITDDQLFVVYPGDWFEGKHPLMGRIWSLNTEGELKLSLEVEFPIENIDVRFIPYAPTQLGDGRLAFAIDANASSEMPTIPENRWDSGLYTVSFEDLKPQRVNVLPKGGTQIINWLPDGSGALVRNWTNGSYIYVPFDGSPLWDLTHLLGEEACCFEWLP
jgi:hypothetical protein